MGSDLDAAAARIARLERLLAGVDRSVGGLTRSRIALAQYLREAEAELLGGILDGRVNGGNHGGTLCMIKLIGVNNAPVSGATVRLGVVLLDVLGASAFFDWYDPFDSFYWRTTSTSDASGLTTYELQTGIGPLESGGPSYTYSEACGFMGPVGVTNNYGDILAVFATGYTTTLALVGPLVISPDDSSEHTDWLVPGTLCLGFLTVASTYRAYTFVNRPVTQAMKLTDQHVTASAILFTNVTRGAWTVRYELTSTADGSGGYQLTVRTSGGGPTVTDTFNTATRGLSGGKAQVTYDVVGTTTATRVYPTGSTTITLDEP